MPLQILFWLLGRRISWLAENDPAFRRAMGGRVCVIQFRTRNGRVRQYYAFAAGKAQSRRALHASPSITFSFENVVSAMGLIMKMARDPKDRSVFMNAIRQGKLRLRGDMSLMSWFMMISNHLGPSRKN